MGLGVHLVFRVRPRLLDSESAPSSKSTAFIQYFLPFNIISDEPRLRSDSRLFSCSNNSPTRRGKTPSQYPPTHYSGTSLLRRHNRQAQYSNEKQVNVTCAYELTGLSLHSSNLGRIPRALAVSRYFSVGSCVRRLGVDGGFWLIYYG
jgi:hypothetical protein